MSGSGTPAPPASAKGAARDQIRERLLAAAEEIFGRRGFYGASIAEVTRRAGIAQGSFYLHFPSKEAIFRELMRTRGVELRDTLRRSVKGIQKRSDIERVGFIAFFRWIGDHPWFYRVTRQAEFIDPALREGWYREFAQDYAAALAGAMEAGAIDRTDPEVLGWAIMGMADFIAMRWLVWEGRPGLPSDKLEAFLQIASRALGARAGS